MNVRTAGLAITDKFEANEQNQQKFIFFSDRDKVFSPRQLFSDEFNIYIPTDEEEKKANEEKRKNLKFFFEEKIGARNFSYMQMDYTWVN